MALILQNEVSDLVISSGHMLIIIRNTLFSNLKYTIFYCVTQKGIIAYFRIMIIAIIFHGVQI